MSIFHELTCFFVQDFCEDFFEEMAGHECACLYCRLACVKARDHRLFHSVECFAACAHGRTGWIFLKLYVLLLGACGEIGARSAPGVHGGALKLSSLQNLGAAEGSGYVLFIPVR